MSPRKVLVIDFELVDATSYLSVCSNFWNIANMENKHKYLLGEFGDTGTSYRNVYSKEDKLI